MRAKIINRTDFRTTDLLKACDLVWSRYYWQHNRASVCVVVAYDGDTDAEAEVVANTLGAHKTFALYLPRDCDKAQFAERAQQTTIEVLPWTITRLVESPRYQLRKKPDREQRTQERLARLREKKDDVERKIKRFQLYASWYKEDSYYRQANLSKAAKLEGELAKVLTTLEKLEAEKAA